MDHGGGATGESLGKEERIQARRDRIEDRALQGLDAGNASDAHLNDVSKLADKGPSGEEQILESLHRVDHLKAQTCSRLTLIRLEADEAENARRIKEESKRHTRLRELQDEALESGKQNASIEMRWLKVMQQKLPQDLQVALLAQKGSCAEMIESKDRLISGFREELKWKDDEYIKAIKKQREEVDGLLEGMEEQYMELQKQYSEELDRIENAFVEERKGLVEGNQKELEQLFEERRKMELHFMESKMEREATYADELEKLRTQDAEEYNQLKIKLQMDIQKLEQQLEEMRATYQLNTEKLEYNYRVLTERDMENSTTLSQQKRKLTRLKEALSTLTSKYNQSDVKYKQENTELTEEYRRITKQYKDLQLKFKHFEVSDNKRYREMWRMHEEDIMVLVKHLLRSNNVLHEAFLGLQSPQTPASSFTSHAFFSGLHSEESGYEAAMIEDEVPEGKEEEEEQKEGKEGEEGKTDGEYAGYGKVSSEKVKVMLEMLCSEAGFLIDASLREKLDMLDGEEAVMLQAESILHALGIENENDIHALLPFFFEKADEDEEDLFALELARTDAEALKSLGLKITKNEVIKVIRAFMESKQKEQQKTNNKTNLSAHPTTGNNAGGDDQEVSEEDRYWQYLQQQVVPKETHEMWTAVHRAMQDYNKLLSSRSDLIDQVAHLNQRNAELRHRLQNRLQADDTTALLLPPTRFLR